MDRIKNIFKFSVGFVCFLVLVSSCKPAREDVQVLKGISSPVLFKGNDSTAYRDPAILYNDSTFHLFFTKVEIETDGHIYSYVVHSDSKNLVEWTPPKKLTPRDQNLNFCSPGNIVNFNNEWVLCVTTYPRPDYTIDQGVRYGNGDARIFTMKSCDLKSWTEPELLKLKGDTVPVEQMGRMIDPYLVQDKSDTSKYWCFFKQNGVSRSYSYDLKNWVFTGHAEAGENVCVLVENDEYIMFHSPENGIGIKKSIDLKNWADWGNLITLGQEEWNWAKGRITAGAVIDMRTTKGIDNYLMFFHGSGPLSEPEGDFDKNSSIGIAWSSDLQNWKWPGMK